MGSWIGGGLFLVAMGFFIHWLCEPGSHRPDEADDEDWSTIAPIGGTSTRRR